MQSIKKLIHIKPVEHCWVRKFLRIVKHDDAIRTLVMNKKVECHHMDSILEAYPEIDEHTYSSLGWTIAMSKYVLKSNSEIEESYTGSEYRVTWNE